MGLMFPATFAVDSEEEKTVYGGEYYKEFRSKESVAAIDKILGRWPNDCSNHERGTLTMWGVDQAWFTEDFATLQEFVWVVENMLRCHGSSDFGGEPMIKRAVDMDVRCTGAFGSFCMNINNELNMQIAMAEQAQAKLLAQVATILFTAISFGIAYVQKKFGMLDGAGDDGCECDCS